MPAQVERVRVSLDKPQVRVVSCGTLEHPARKIDTQSERRVQCGEQVALAAANLEYPLIRGYN